MGDLIPVDLKGPDVKSTDAFDKALGDAVRPISAADIPETCETSWDRTNWMKKHEDELRSRAAEIAVDMETGEWPGHERGSFSYREVQVAMGFSDKSDRLFFMRDPDFARAVQWERTKREANFRMTVSDMRPLLSVGASAGVLELVRRMLETPRSMKSTELIEIVNKFLGHLGADGSQKPKDVRETVVVFLKQVDLLPESARAKALGLFNNELNAITAIARRVEDAS